MKLCPACEGEGVVIEGLPTDDPRRCKRCEGRGFVDIPEYIYLQINPDGETTWCEDRIDPYDIEYKIVPVTED